MLDIALVEGVRTPFAKAFGPLAFVPAHELGRLATQALLQRANVRPTEVDQVIFGNVVLPAEAANKIECSPRISSFSSWFESRPRNKSCCASLPM